MGTWYRGEGAGVSPSKPGTDMHDLGDGLYLTDEEDVAWKYARLRAPQHKDYRIWQADFDPSTLGRVLDLTADPRWNKFIMAPDPKLMNKSRLFYLRQQNELYNQFFNEFLRVHGIDIEFYDAVIGPEYVRGGKQLCVLSKKGMGTKQQARVRALLRPEPWARRLAQTQGAAGKPSATPPTPKPTGSMKNFIKLASVQVAMSGFKMLVDMINQWQLDKFNERTANNRMAQLQPEIEKWIIGMQRVILDYLYDGDPAWAVATVVSAYVSRWEEDETGGGQAGYGLSVLADVLIDYVNVTNRKVHREDKPYTEYRYLNTSRIDYSPFTVSWQITLPKEIVDEYRDARDQ